MTLNTHPEDRKAMAVAISLELNKPCEYMRMPTCAYRIGEITVNKDGTTESENAELINQIKPMLISNGWLDEEPAEEISEPDEDTAEEPTAEFSKLFLRIPVRDWTILSLQNFIRIVYTKQKLINRMAQLGEEITIATEVIERMENTAYTTITDLEALLKQTADERLMKNLIIGPGQILIMLPYSEQYPERWSDVGTLMTNIINAAKLSKRVRAEIQELGDNEKYMANAWLNRLGFGGPDFKALRHRLMHHLNGYAAFRNNERMLAHREKLTAKRRAERNTTEEVHENE